MDAVLLKTDSTGNKEWRATFGGVESDMCFEVHQTEDEGYIVQVLLIHTARVDKRYGW